LLAIPAVFAAAQSSGNNPTPSSAPASKEQSQSSTSSAAPNPGASGQQAQPPGDQAAPGPDDLARFKIGTNEVNVVFTVTDKHGRHITDLKQSDFRVLDDKKPAEEVRSFHSETTLPLQVGLLIDASNSVRD